MAQQQAQSDKSWFISPSTNLYLTNLDQSYTCSVFRNVATKALRALRFPDQAHASASPSRSQWRGVGTHRNP
jgi:hypothetical protein